MDSSWALIELVNDSIRRNESKYIILQAKQ
jgi:hypothetical protein